MKRSPPYVYAFFGLLGGLSVLTLMPLPSAILNYIIGGALLAVAVAAIMYMIVRGSGPEERGPDF